MKEFVESVVNISEGRDLEIVDAVAAGVGSCRGAWLLSRSVDYDHNRSVLTLIGSPRGVFEAVARLFREAVALIDISRHRGIHPRIGAVDVVPFVPLWGAQMERCVELARAFGTWVADRYAVPVYLYEEAATSPQRRNLAEIRRGQFEGLSLAVGQDPGRRPDFGVSSLHPTAGAVAVGARGLLIAFNVVLESTDLALAQRIARQVREKDGGLKSVKALGLYLASRDRVQVSMNLTDFRQTPPRTALTAVRQFAAERGVRVECSEVVGHLPRAALAGGGLGDLMLREFSGDLILEDAFGRVSGMEMPDL